MKLDVWPLLEVQALPRSIEFYTTCLGFRIVGTAGEGDDMFWCRLERGGASLMLQQAANRSEAAANPSPGMSLYFVCEDAHALYEEFSRAGLTLEDPFEADYGMVQLFVPEPDGYMLCFESRTADWVS